MRFPKWQPCACGIEKEDNLWIRGPISITTERVFRADSILIFSRLNLAGGVIVSVFWLSHFTATPILSKISITRKTSSINIQRRLKVKSVSPEKLDQKIRSKSMVLNRNPQNLPEGAGHGWAGF